MIKYLIILFVFVISCKKEHHSIPDSIIHKIYEKNDYNGAIIDLKNLLESDLPNDDLYYKLDIYYYLGNCYSDIGEYHLAIESYNKFMDISPNICELIPSVYFNRGLAKYSLKEYGAAADDFNFSINASPEDPSAYLSRAKAFAKLGMINSACEDFDFYIFEGGELTFENDKIISEDGERSFSKEEIEEINIIYKQCGCR